MEQDYIEFSQTGYFSPLICDYLKQNSSLKAFYNRFPKLDNFQDQIKEKEKSFSLETRACLVSVLNIQYKHIEISKKTKENILSLSREKTFTVTTGHQLNVFTGPLYFLYKIISAINLSEQLNKKYTQHHFVPVYWMATEDHDFDEINYFNFKEKKLQWHKDAHGAVGELSTEGLKALLDLFSKNLGESIRAKKLKNLFKDAYLNHDNLADASRFLTNTLFKDFGLVIIDGNDKRLKQLFKPYIETELFEKTSLKTVSETNKKLLNVSETYKIQVNPREINLFYLSKGLRERIVFENGFYKVLNTDIVWSKEAIKKEVFNFPEKFSPNVIMRPLYQEVVLPNLCYIGGGGELAYWMQLKDFFDSAKVVFPILLLRNSVLIKNENQFKKLQNLNISDKSLFLEEVTFVNKKVKEISAINIDFSEQKKYLKAQFKDLYELSKQTDKSFLGAVKAQEVKQIKGLDNLEKRLLKAQKIKMKDAVERMLIIKNDLFPKGSLQERHANFSELYLEHGEDLIAMLIKNLNPLDLRFLILNL